MRWVALLLLAGSLLACPPEPCSPTDRESWWVEGLCCVDGEVYVCEGDAGP